MNKYDLICFGEILWDIYPDGSKVIGGAPLNVALRCNGFGINSGIISRLGKDDMANAAYDFLLKREMDSGMVQDDNDWPTGFVDITISEHGSAVYNIKKPAAWDYIKLTETNIEAVEHAPVFIYGSLAARSEISQRTLKRLVTKANYKIFDVNLRTNGIFNYNWETRVFIKFTSI